MIVDVNAKNNCRKELRKKYKIEEELEAYKDNNRYTAWRQSKGGKSSGILNYAGLIIEDSETSSHAKQEFAVTYSLRYLL